MPDFVVGDKGNYREREIFYYICSMSENCSHFDSKHVKHAKGYECEECVKIGSDWVHLRTCQTCGVTLCCDNSPNKHATKHYHASDHPTIISAEPGENWAFCYPDELFMRY